MGRTPPDHDGPDQCQAARRPAVGGPRHGRRRVAAAWLSLVGLVGSVLCSAAMVAAAVGLFTTAATTAAHRSSMPGMGTAAGDGGLPDWLDALVRFGPQLLVASLALLAVGIGLRRPAALAPAALGGAILYVGMYQQPSLAWMSAAITAGTLLLLLAYLATSRPGTGQAQPKRRRHTDGAVERGDLAS